MMMTAKRPKVHGKTFLTRPRWVTYSYKKATTSKFVWGQVNEGAAYTLSLVGIINGILTRVGLVLTVKSNTATHEIYGYQVMKKWW